MKVSVIIVSYNVRAFLQVCLHSVLRAATALPVEVIVVDNQSADDSVSMVQRVFPQVKLIANEDNRGFSKANNQGVAIAAGEYILFLNPDTVMPEDFLQKMVGYMDAHPEAGSIGPRLIDGRGVFAPDGKKSFPTLSVAIFKTAGLGRLFPRSALFNAYYAPQVGEHETASVEVLSGCCMMVRRSVIVGIGGAFDEDYFMYCEDVDLSFRIRQAGFQNVYFPETTLIHYKGESTRKASISYIRIFNEALATFVRKHYSSRKAAAFRAFINVGILLRALLGVLRSLFKVLRMPLFDALVLLGTLFVMMSFWVEKVKDIKPISLHNIALTFPVYILLWIVSLYLNGAYDAPYRALRVVRGMMVGAVAILAYYGLLPSSLRYSRVLIMLSGVVGTVALLGLHEVLSRLGIFRLPRYDEVPRKAVIAGDEAAYADTRQLLGGMPYAPDIIGRVGAERSAGQALSALPDMQPMLFTAGVQEVIFCVDDELSYQRMMEAMQACGADYEYKIHLPGTTTFVGSNSSNTPGDVYSADGRFPLSSFAQQRNKRLLDILAALALLLAAPVLAFIIRGQLLRNAVAVLRGRKTWVGYAGVGSLDFLPGIRPSVLPPWRLTATYTPPPALQQELVMEYARNYRPGIDLLFLWQNLRYAGRP